LCSRNVSLFRYCLDAISELKIFVEILALEARVGSTVVIRFQFFEISDIASEETSS
jgi:hypothetical protein